MHIEKQFASLKIWAEQNKVLLVAGEFELHKSPVVDIPNSEENALITFQEIIKKLDVKVIIYAHTQFDTENFELYENTLEEMDDDELKAKFEQFRKFEGKLLGYNLLIFKDGITFRFEEYISEIEDYLEIQEAVIDYIEEEDGDENGSLNTMPQEKATEFGKILAESDNYSKLKNRTQRESLAREMFSSQIEKLGVREFSGIYSTVNYAEVYYENTIKPAKEKELKLKVTELINKGLTKVKIAATLGISKDAVNKYI